MKDLFSPDEFAKINGTTIHEDHCNYVNQKLNKLIKSWPVVLLGDSSNHPSHDKWVVDDGGFRMDKFVKKARLAFIEKIPKEPCRHEPRHSIMGEKVENTYLGYRCKHCGVELQATWSEKK